MRPMPGAARMYPETDVKPVLITSKKLKEIELPELIDEKIMRHQKIGLSAELARSLVKEGFDLEDYEYRLSKKLIANVLVEIPKDIRKRHGIDYEFKEKEFRFILEALELNKISKDSVIDILMDIAKGKEVNLGEYSPMDTSKLEKEIAKLVKENKGFTTGALMGLVMKKFSGKVDGKLAAKLVMKYNN